MSEPTSLAERRAAPVPEVIQMAKEILAGAEAGTIRCLAWVAVKPGGYVNRGSTDASKEGHGNTMMSGISGLFYAYAKSMDDGGYEAPIDAPP